MTGQERREAGDNTNRPHPGPASSVRDAEGLVEVQVANVGADVSGTGESHLGVHVSSVHVHLRAGRGIKGAGDGVRSTQLLLELVIL